MPATDALFFWMMKPLAELAVAISISAVVVGVYLVAILPGVIRQRRCKHARFREDGSCDAWCTDCGKNLGFIGALRKKRAPTSAGG